jgi:hypothetical protein
MKDIDELQERWTCFNYQCFPANRCVPCRLNLEKVDQYVSKRVLEELKQLYDTRYALGDIGWSRFVITANDVKKRIMTLEATAKEGKK